MNETFAPKDQRFVHPLEGRINPVVSETYYQLAAALHYLRLFDQGMVAGDYFTVLAKKNAAEQTVHVWNRILHHAHVATYTEHDTTWVSLTMRLPEWAEGDANAVFATPDGEYVLYRDAEQATCAADSCAPWVPVWDIAHWTGETDETIARTRTVRQARAVIAARQAPLAGPAPRR